MRGVRPFACCELPYLRGEEAMSSHAHALHYIAVHAIHATRAMHRDAYWPSLDHGMIQQMDQNACLFLWVTHSALSGQIHRLLPENEAVSIMGHGRRSMGSRVDLPAWIV
jgi:hypothetical protein